MQINLRSPRTQKWIIFITVLFGLGYGYVNFLYLPRRALIESLTVNIKQESELLARGKRIAANYQTVENDYERLMATWEIARELLPTQKEMEGLLKSITLCGQSNNVEFALFKPLEPIERPYFWETPIQIRTISDYHDLGAFLSSVAALERIVNVNDLKLTAFQPKKGRSPQTVVADFTATIYVFKELGAPMASDSITGNSGKVTGGRAKSASKPSKPRPAAQGKGEQT